MGLETIHALERQAERQAARNGVEPYVWTGKERVPPFPFPNIGSHRPKGWKLVRGLFCDSSGCGATDEPALTPDQLVATLVPGFGYAIIKEGQFQLYVGEFRRSGSPS